MPGVVEDRDPGDESEEDPMSEAIRKMIHNRDVVPVRVKLSGLGTGEDPTMVVTFSFDDVKRRLSGEK